MLMAQNYKKIRINKS